MIPGSAKISKPNPLARRDPGLVERLTAFRRRITEMLLDQLAAAALHDPAFRAEECPHSIEDVQATVQILRVLTKEAWDQDDLALFDASWPQATRADLFADEFKAERHRIRKCVEDAQKSFARRRHTH
jgi:hypothetical protein